MGVMGNSKDVADILWVYGTMETKRGERVLGELEAKMWWMPGKGVVGEWEIVGLR